MGYKFNPLTGNLDDAGSGGSPGGSNTQIQFNDAGAFGGDADLTWNKTTNVLTNKGDINLDDGGTYTTTVQCVTPTANRTISFPDATGTVALVAGSSGQLTYNNAGAQAGATGSVVDSSGNVTIGGLTTLAGSPSANNTSGVLINGTWRTGASSNNPQLLLNPSGTTLSTTWSTSGTGIGVNAPALFGGNLLDLQVNGTPRLRVSGDGALSLTSSAAITPLSISHGFNSDIVSITRSAGTGKALTISEAGFGPTVDITKSTAASTSNSNSAGIVYTATYAHTGSFGMGRGIDISVTNNTGTSGTLYGGLINATANSSGATAVGLSVNVSSTSGTKYAALFTGGNVGFGVTAPSSLLELADAGHITVGTTTGTKIGTATTQKLGFYNKTPVVQPTAVADATDAASVITQLNALLARMRDLGLIAT